MRKLGVVEHLRDDAIEIRLNEMRVPIGCETVSVWITARVAMATM